MSSFQCHSAGSGKDTRMTSLERKQDGLAEKEYFQNCVLFGTSVKARASVQPAAGDRAGLNRERGWFLPGRMKINMWVPSSQTFTQDRKPHCAVDYSSLGRPGQLKCLSSCAAGSLQNRAEFKIYAPGPEERHLEYTTHVGSWLSPPRSC